MPVESVTVVAHEVRVGPFILSKGLVEQINDFQTLSLRDFSALNMASFLSIHDDYFYHTQFPLHPQEVFAKEHQSNTMKTWGLRAAGWALMFISIQLTTRILYTLVDWVPLLRDLVSFGLKIFAVCLSCSLSLLVIGIGWLFYRPLVAVALGALALLPVFLARSGLPPKKKE
ncbi:hypothetical protein GOODEAATRI_014237 [Goodea atripinnis]|uniref:Uncharacterized protein n=1 Tax=Goodea atripinnis TaxID=208336 RepID=A0ABV0PE58_9TELE